MTEPSMTHQPLVIDLPATRGYIGRHRRTLTPADRAERRRARLHRAVHAAAHTISVAVAAALLLTLGALAVIL